MTAPVVDPVDPTVPADEEEAGEDGVGAGFARKINDLFEKLQQQGIRLSNEDVAEAITAAGTKISASYLWLLRTGKRDNPGRRHIEALAAYFGVPVEYFFDSDLREFISKEFEVVAALRHAGVRRLAVRAVGLPPDVLDALLVMVEQARRAQGLPAGAHDASGAGEDRR